MGRAILKAERETLTSIRGGACQLLWTKEISLERGELPKKQFSLVCVVGKDGGGDERCLFRASWWLAVPITGLEGEMSWDDSYRSLHLEAFVASSAEWGG